MLRLWMMFPLAAAFRSSIGDGDEMCCCYKKKKAFSGICVKDGIAYQTLRSRDEDKFDFVNRTVDFVTYSTYFDQKTEVKRTLYLKLTPLGPVSAAESLKLFGYRYNKNNENKYVKDVAKLLRLGKGDSAPEVNENGHPVWSHCGSPSVEPIDYYELAPGEETKPAPSECLRKEDLKSFAGVRVCPSKMTRFFCDCKGQC